MYTSSANAPFKCVITAAFIGALIKLMVIVGTLLPPISSIHFYTNSDSDLSKKKCIVSFALILQALRSFSTM